MGKVPVFMSNILARQLNPGSATFFQRNTDKAGRVLWCEAWTIDSHGKKTPGYRGIRHFSRGRQVREIRVHFNRDWSEL